MRNGFNDCNMSNNLEYLIAIESAGCCCVKEQLTHFDMNTHSELRLTGLPDRLLFIAHQKEVCSCDSVSNGS